MRVSKCNRVLFYEGFGYDTVPAVYATTDVVYPHHLSNHYPALVYCTDSNRITAASALRFLENTTRNGEGDIIRISSSLLAYTLGLYVKSISNGTKNTVSLSAVCTKPLMLTTEETFTHSLRPAKSKKKKNLCSETSHIGQFNASEDAVFYADRSICDSCWKLLKRPDRMWHTLQSVKLFLNKDAYKSVIIPLQQKGLWFRVCREALQLPVVESEFPQVIVDYISNPFLQYVSHNDHTNVAWSRLAGIEACESIRKFPKAPLWLQRALTDITEELLHTGWCVWTTPKETTKGCRLILAVVSNSCPPPYPVLCRYGCFSRFMFSAAFYNCVTHLVKTDIKITVSLCAPFFACIPSPSGASISMENIRNTKSIPPKCTITASELLTWDTLFILLRKCTEIEFRGSYVTARHGVKSPNSCVTAGYAFMCLVDWCVADGPYDRITVNCLDESVRPTRVTGLEKDDDIITQSWPVVVHALSNHTRPSSVWPPTLSVQSTLLPLCRHKHKKLFPRIKQFRLPRVKNIILAQENNRNKRPYNDILSSGVNSKRKKF